MPPSIPTKECQFISLQVQGNVSLQENEAGGITAIIPEWHLVIILM